MLVQIAKLYGWLAGPRLSLQSSGYLACHMNLAPWTQIFGCLFVGESQSSMLATWCGLASIL